MLGRSETRGPTAVKGWMAGSESRPSQRQAWPFLFQNAHVGYITWDEYEANRQQLRQNRQTFGGDRRHGPAREGPALLQGLVICGKCGNRMTIRYHQAEKGTHLIPEYVCQKERVEQATEQTCQHILGAGLDAAMADLLLAQVTPFTIDTARAASMKNCIPRSRRHSTCGISKSNEPALLPNWPGARFLRVDPENRLVASVLEAEWNARLQEYTQVQEEALKHQEKEQRRLSTLEQQAIANLVEDFPRVWHDERTLDRDRKRLVRLLLEDVTLRKDEMITAQVRFKGGATQTLTLPISQGRRSAQEVLTLIDQLLDDYTDARSGRTTQSARMAHLRRQVVSCDPYSVIAALSSVEGSWRAAPGARVVMRQ